MIIIVIGTRPELIKIFPLVGELKKKKLILRLFILDNTTLVH